MSVRSEPGRFLLRGSQAISEFAGACRLRGPPPLGLDICSQFCRRPTAGRVPSTGRLLSECRVAPARSGRHAWMYVCNYMHVRTYLCTGRLLAYNVPLQLDTIFTATGPASKDMIIG